MSAKEREARYFVVLSKLEQIGQPMNLLEIGFTATPQFIRNMAARGMVKVTVAMTERGREVLEKERNKRLRAKVKQERELRAARLLAGAR